MFRKKVKPAPKESPNAGHPYREPGVVENKSSLAAQLYETSQNGNLKIKRDTKEILWPKVVKYLRKEAEQGNTFVKYEEFLTKVMRAAGIERHDSATLKSLIEENGCGVEMLKEKRYPNLDGELCIYWGPKPKWI